MLSIAKVVVYFSISFFIFVVILAIVDHFIFMEKFRYLLSILGKISLFIFYFGVVIILLIGIKEKLK